MSKALSNRKKKKDEKALSIFDSEKYYGIDVKTLGIREKSLLDIFQSTLQKTISNFIISLGIALRMCQDFFTTVNFKEEDSDRYFDLLPESMDKYNIHYS